jgi:TnpA family transposase
MSLRACELFAAESRNVRTFLTLAEKVRIMAVLPQFRRSHCKQSAKKILIRSEGWLASTESFEFAPRGELKKRKLAHQGRQALAYRLMERAAVPARGFADRTRAASDPARPA